VATTAGPWSPARRRCSACAPGWSRGEPRASGGGLLTIDHAQSVWVRRGLFSRLRRRWGSGWR
jgi:hypothetical protein